MPKRKSHSPQKVHLPEKLTNQIAANLGIPSEFLTGAKAYSGSSMTLQMISNMNVKASAVISRNGKQIGKPVGFRRCRLEGCLGLCIGTRWKDGKLTWPCTKGMKEAKPGIWEIE